MRTTLTLDDDVAADLRRVQEETGESWKEVVNEMLRAGVIARSERRHHARPVGRTRGVRLGRPLIGEIANVHEALSIAEGDARS